jgi:hypothetical protein
LNCHDEPTEVQELGDWIIGMRMAHNESLELVINFIATFLSECHISNSDIE